MDAVTLMMIGVLDYVREEIEHRYETLYNKYIYIYIIFLGNNFVWYLITYIELVFTNTLWLTNVSF